MRRENTRVFPLPTFVLRWPDLHTLPIDGVKVRYNRNTLPTVRVLLSTISTLFPRFGYSENDSPRYPNERNTLPNEKLSASPGGARVDGGWKKNQVVLRTSSPFSFSVTSTIRSKIPFTRECYSPYTIETKDDCLAVTQ